MLAMANIGGSDECCFQQYALNFSIYKVYIETIVSSVIPENFEGYIHILLLRGTGMKQESQGMKYKLGELIWARLL